MMNTSVNPHFRVNPFRRKLLEWYRQNDRKLAWRLDFKRTQSPYPVWVSEIMLQQTQISTVTPVYRRFMEKFPSIKHLAEATEEEIKEAVRGLGYYRRFSLLHKAAQKLVENGPSEIKWPIGFFDWQNLPGIGPYTAAALASIVNQETHMVVDGNVERVFARLFDIRENVAIPAWKKTFKSIGDDIIDPEHPGDFNQAIMEIGQLVCRPNSPACNACPLSYTCKSFKASSTHLAPGPKPKTKYIETGLRLIVPLKKGKIGIAKRPDSSRFLKGIKGFLTEEDGSTLFTEEQIVGTIKHSITKHKISAKVTVMHGAPNKSEWKDLKYYGAEELEPLLTSNLDRKALKLLLKRKSSLGLL